MSLIPRQRLAAGGLLLIEYEVDISHIHSLSSFTSTDLSRIALTFRRMVGPYYRIRIHKRCYPIKNGKSLDQNDNYSLQSAIH